MRTVEVFMCDKCGEEPNIKLDLDLEGYEVSNNLCMTCLAGTLKTVIPLMSTTMKLEWLKAIKGP